MRMWMINPATMCRQHLLGEHNEIHKLVGHLLKKKRITGWIKANCLEPQSIIQRHNELVKEMTRRGFNHQSPLQGFDISYLPDNEKRYRINADSSLQDLLKRCPNCWERNRINSTPLDKPTVLSII